MSEIPRTNNPYNNPDHANDNPRTQENGHTESGYTRGQKIGAGVAAFVALGIGGFKAGEHIERTKQEPVVTALEEDIDKLRERIDSGEEREMRQSAEALSDHVKKTAYDWIGDALQPDESGALPKMTFGYDSEEDRRPEDHGTLRVGKLEITNHGVVGTDQAVVIRIHSPAEVNDAGEKDDRRISFSGRHPVQTVEELLAALDDYGTGGTIESGDEQHKVRLTAVPAEGIFVQEMTPAGPYFSNEGISWASAQEMYPQVLNGPEISSRDNLKSQMDRLRSTMDPAQVDEFLGVEEIVVEPPEVLEPEPTTPSSDSEPTPMPPR